MSIRTWFAIVISLFLIGCDSDSGTNEALCRTYPSKINVSGSSVSSGYPNVVLPTVVWCSFDTQNLQLSCHTEYNDNYGSTGMQSKTWIYSTLQDFVEEGLIMGATRSLSISFSDTGVGGPPLLIPDRPIQGTNSFDTNHRLLTSSNLIFSAWDNSGRPTESLPTDICTQDQGHRYIYNDSQREVIHTYNSRTSTRPPDMTIPCIPYTIRTVFDSQGNVIAIDDIRYEIVETKTACTETN